MPSIQAEPRQIPTGQQYYTGSSIFGLLFQCALDFIPAPGNYVANYPPGYVITGLDTELGKALLTANTSAGQFLIRDMGKTIFASFGSLTGNKGYYRQFQLLRVNPITSTQGFIGGPTGTTFGIVGNSSVTPPSTSTYATFYLDETTAGVLGAYCGTNQTVLNPVAGGQM